MSRIKDLEMKTITIKDIAEKTGVSKTTVSRVLSNPTMVNEETRLKILAVIEKYSYIPNRLAQGLAGNHTKSIGVIIDELSNYFYIEIAEGIDMVLSSNDYSMQISSSRWIKNREIKLVRNLISNRVDGVLLAPVAADSESIGLLKNSGIPFILLNCISEDDSVPYVSCDNVTGGKLVAQYINQHPSEQTIIVTGFYHQTLNDRKHGFVSNYNLNVPLKEYRDINTFEDGYELVPILATRDKIAERKTSIFVANDNVALGLIQRLVEFEIEVPTQVSVIGYDNIKLSGISQIPLTTVSQSIKEMGRIAAMELIEMIDNPTYPPPHHLIKPMLVTRKSSG